MGHPIVGDKIYGPDEQLVLRFIETRWAHELEQRLLLPRHALHSAKLAIEEKREWTARSLRILPNSVTAISERRLQGAAVSSPPMGDLPPPQCYGAPREIALP